MAEGGSHRKATALAILGLLALLAGGCASDPADTRGSVCDWQDGRHGCEEEKVHCADPRNCY